MSYLINHNGHCKSYHINIWHVRRWWCFIYVFKSGENIRDNSLIYEICKHFPFKQYQINSQYRWNSLLTPNLKLRHIYVIESKVSDGNKHNWKRGHQNVLPCQIWTYECNKILEWQFIELNRHTFLLLI